MRLQFKEFTRLNIGSAWYVISDPLPGRWRFHLRWVKKSEAAEGADLNGDGDMMDEVWVNNASEVAHDNDKWVDPG